MSIIVRQTHIGDKICPKSFRRKLEISKIDSRKAANWFSSLIKKPNCSWYINWVKRSKSVVKNGRYNVIWNLIFFRGGHRWWDLFAFSLISIYKCFVFKTNVNSWKKTWHRKSFVETIQETNISYVSSILFHLRLLQRLEYFTLGDKYCMLLTLVCMILFCPIILPSSIFPRFVHSANFLLFHHAVWQHHFYRIHVMR
jgi:hypothetical protein